jgi:hypothetical protein
MRIHNQIPRPESLLDDRSDDMKPANISLRWGFFKNELGIRDRIADPPSQLLLATRGTCDQSSITIRVSGSETLLSDESVDIRSPGYSR